MSSTNHYNSSDVQIFNLKSYSKRLTTELTKATEFHNLWNARLLTQVLIKQKEVYKHFCQISKTFDTESMFALFLHQLQEY